MKFCTKNSFIATLKQHRFKNTEVNVNSLSSDSYFESDFKKETENVIEYFTKPCKPFIYVLHSTLLFELFFKLHYNP